MPFLSRQDFFNGGKPREPKRELVTIPDMGDVYVREMTARERDRFDQWLVSQGNSEASPDSIDSYRGQLCARVIVGEDGSRLFSDEDAAVLGDMPVSMLNAAFDVALRLNRMRKQDVEDAQKNLPPSAGSPSA